MNCCFRDEWDDECPNRRMAQLPMCEKHMRLTFRIALVEGVLPADVFKVICQDATEALGLKMRFDEMALDAALATAQRNRDTAEAKRKADATGAVYYVRLTGDRVKIGFTTNLASRLASYRARPEDLLAVEAGPRELEGRRHRQFAADRIDKRLEDFTLSEALTAHIASLNGQVA